MEFQISQVLCLLLALSTIKSCVSLPVELVSDQNASQLKSLLKQLAQMEKQRENENVPEKTTPSLIEEPAKPVKRNCQVGLSNDCGSIHAAYMNGMRNFLSSKRQFRLPSWSEVGEQLSLKSVGEDNIPPRLNYEENSLIKERLIGYLEAMEKKQEDERDQNEIMCLALTGLPCGQVWSN